MDDEILKKNIKYLRNCRGMTQKELSQKLGYGNEESDSNPVKDWEREKHIPDNMIEEIANLFEISIDLLKNVDLELVNEFLCDTPAPVDEYFVEYLKRMFPYSENSEALKNDKFVKAYNIHMKLLKLDIDENVYDISLESYNLYKQAYKDGINEGIINMLSISCLYKFYAKNYNFNAQNDEKETIKIPEFNTFSEFQAINENLRRRFIKQNTIYNSQTKIKEIEKFISNTTEEIFEVLLEIKKIPSYRELLDYYIAIMSINNLLDMKYKKSENFLFGQIYLDILYDLKNPYVENFVKFEPDISNITKCE